MSICSYVYDANGLRWEEGSVAVRLLVNGEVKVLAVVRPGQGTSRVDRFEGVPHALDSSFPEGKIAGEISMRDLESLTLASSVEIARAGRRFSVRVPEDVLAVQVQRARADRSFPAEAFHTVDGQVHRFAVGFLPSRAQGEAGRRFDEASVNAFLEGLAPEDRRILALAQVASMPKSGRAGGPVARRRLRLFAGELGPVEFLDALDANPDALLHVTQGLVDDFASRHGGDADAVRGFDRLVGRVLDDGASEGGNVLLAALYAHMVSVSGVPAVFETDVVALRSSLVERLADEIHARSSDLLALEVLATADRQSGPDVGAVASRELAVSALRSAFSRGPGRTLSPSMGSFLARLHDKGAPELLESLLEEHPAQVVCTPDFLVMLPTEVRLDAVRREPRLALEHLELDRTGEEVAVNELLRRGEPVPAVRAEVIAAQRRSHAETIRAVVDVSFRELVEFEEVFSESLRRIREVGSSLERERLLAYGGLASSMREFFWPALRRIKDLGTCVEMLEFEVRSPFQSPAGYLDSASRRLLEDLAEVPPALESLRFLVKLSADRLESLRALARDGASEDFHASAERVVADVSVAMHRYMGVVLEAVKSVPVASPRPSPVR